MKTCTIWATAIALAPLTVFATDSLTPSETNSTDANLGSILPQTGYFSMSEELISIPMDDGLEFHLLMKVEAKGQGDAPLVSFSPLFNSKSATAGPVLLSSLDGNTEILNLSTGDTGYSTDHYQINYSKSPTLLSANVTSPDGVLYTVDKLSQPQKEVIYSAHKKSNIQYLWVNDTQRQSYGCHNDHGNVEGCKYISWSEGSRLKEITLSNGYKVDFHYQTISERKPLNCHNDHGNLECHNYVTYTYHYLSALQDNQGNTWKVDMDRSYKITKLTFPNGDTTNFSANKITSDTGLGYSFNNHKLTYQSNNLLGKNEQIYTITSGNHIITHSDGSKDLYHYLPSTESSTDYLAFNRHIHAYDKHLIEDKSGKVLYDEENSWTDVKGVPVLTKQTITQDGVTTTKAFSNFNEFLYPQTIVTTASNGQTITTKTDYFKLGASATHGHMVKPQTITVTDSKGKVIRTIVNQYNSEGYLITSTVNGIKTTYSYDNKGNLATETDASGNTTQYLDYTNGQPQRVIDPNGHTTKYTYDYRGLMLTTADAKGNVTKYTYDVMGRVKSVTPPIGNPTTYVYTNHGLTITKTQGSAVTTTNYDGFGRVINSTITDGNNADKIVQVNKYDPVNNRRFSSYPCRSADKCTVGDVYTYDALGRAISLVKDTTSF